MTNFNHQKAFLFMPDISGFTSFINKTEIEHSTHIVQELLEILIDNNQLKMEIMEVEGDAIFFFRFGSLPSANEIIKQSKEMFVKFHEHLLQYETRRICQCGACRYAINLTVKFFVHAGNVSSYYIHNRHKLIGKDVILIHRLLKNSVQDNEYVLFTNTFLVDDIARMKNKYGYQLFMKSEEYDNQLVHYSYLPIVNWREMVPVPVSIDSDRESELLTIFTASKELLLPAQDVFNYVADLSLRREWIEHTKNIEIESGLRINRSGLVHKCVLENNSTVEFEAGFFKIDENEFSFSELDAGKGNFGYRFTIKKLSPLSCVIHIEYLLNKSKLRKMLFRLFTEKSLRKSLANSLENLQKRISG